MTDRAPVSRYLAGFVVLFSLFLSFALAEGPAGAPLAAPAVSPSGGAPGLAMKVVVQGGGTEDASTIYWWSGRWMDATSEGAAVVDLVRNRILLINHADKTWTGGPVDSFLQEMEREASRLAASVNRTYRLVKRGKKRPVEDSLKVEVEPRGKDSVNGRSCRHYRLWLEGRMEEEVWVDPELSLSKYFPAEKLVDVLVRFGAANAVLSREFGDIGEFRAEQAIQQAMARLLLKGMEVRSRDYSNGKVTFEKNLVEVTPWAGNEAAFAPPEGYREVSYGEFMESGIVTPRDPLGDDPRE